MKVQCHLFLFPHVSEQIILQLCILQPRKVFFLSCQDYKNVSNQIQLYLIYASAGILWFINKQIQLIYILKLYLEFIIIQWVREIELLSRRGNLKIFFASVSPTSWSYFKKNYVSLSLPYYCHWPACNDELLLVCKNKSLKCKSENTPHRFGFQFVMETFFHPAREHVIASTVISQ